VSIVTLLSLTDDQIDVVADTVREWCSANKHDINGGNGRSAMQTVVALALVDRWEPKEFAERLCRELDRGLESAQR
jgi:hypothetical protein